MFEKKYIAHRGASGYAPENTMVAFKKAAAMGAEWIELDVMLSADGKPFVFHDEELERTTNGRGSFGEVDSNYIGMLDAGGWFSEEFEAEPIPTLEQVLTWISPTRLNLNIEIKPYPGFSHETTMAALQAIHRYWPTYEERILISSFDVSALKLCRQFEPEMRMGLLLNKWQDDSIACAKELDCFSVHLNRKIASPSRILALKEAGFKVCVFTVNRRREAMKFLALGVDAVFTNYPDIFELTLKRKLFKKFLDKKSVVA